MSENYINWNLWHDAFYEVLTEFDFTSVLFFEKKMNLANWTVSETELRNRAKDVITTALKSCSLEKDGFCFTDRMCATARIRDGKGIIHLQYIPFEISRGGEYSKKDVEPTAFTQEDEWVGYWWDQADYEKRVGNNDSKV